MNQLPPSRMSLFSSHTISFATMVTTITTPTTPNCLLKNSPVSNKSSSRLSKQTTGTRHKKKCNMILRPFSDLFNLINKQIVCTLSQQKKFHIHRSSCPEPISSFKFISLKMGTIFNIWNRSYLALAKSKTLASNKSQ